MGYLLKCFYRRGFPLVLFRKFDDAVQSDPCHDLGVRIMLWWLSCFPDSVVRFVPYLVNCFTQSDQKSSRIVIKFWFKFLKGIKSIQYFAVYIHLNLFVDFIANTNRSRRTISFQPIQCFFLQPRMSKQRIDHLNTGTGQLGRMQNPVQKCLGFLFKSESDENTYGEGGIP